MTPPYVKHMLLAALLALALAPLATAGDAPHPLDRTVRLDLWGVNLNDAARAISEQAGVEVVFYRPDFPADQNANTIHLVTGQVSVRTVLESLGRCHGFRYRVSDTGRIEISKGYGWVPSDDYALRFPRLDRLLPAGGGDLDRLRRELAEFVKPLPLLNGDFSLSLVRSPAPENPHSAKGEAVLPPILADYFEKAVRCLSGEAGDLQTAPSSVRPVSGKFAHRPVVEWESLLLREFDVPRDADIRAALRNVAALAGIALISSEPPPADASSPLSGIAERRSTLGRITGELAKRLSQGRRVFLDSGAVSFESCRTEEWENDHRSREFFWNGLTVAGFDAKKAAENAGGGEALVAAIRRDVFPAVWRDPVTAIGYNAVTGRAAVVAPQNVALAVGTKISELATTPAADPFR